MSRGADCRYTPSLARSFTVQPVSDGARSEFTAANTMRNLYHRLAAIVRVVPLTAPFAHTVSSHSTSVPPAAWQLFSYCCATAVSSGMSKWSKTKTISSSDEISSGREPAGSSTMIIPAAPPPA
eukprot:2258954-Pleurochrysis_carterae.AAC.2